MAFAIPPNPQGRFPSTWPSSATQRSRHKLKAKCITTADDGTHLVAGNPLPVQRASHLQHAGFPLDDEGANRRAVGPLSSDAIVDSALFFFAGLDLIGEMGCEKSVMGGWGWACSLFHPLNAKGRTGAGPRAWPGTEQTVGATLPGPVQKCGPQSLAEGRSKRFRQNVRSALPQAEMFGVLHLWVVPKSPCSEMGSKQIQ